MAELAANGSPIKDNGEQKLSGPTCKGVASNIRKQVAEVIKAFGICNQTMRVLESSIF